MNAYPTLGAVALLTAITLGVLRAYGAPQPSAPTWAILRGALQLALISLVLARVIASPVWVGVALAIMFGVAA